jgi:acyl-CoA thioester hydrolase
MVPTQLRVIYGDTDQMGIVYYANYLRFFEAGRNEYLRARGARYRDVEARHQVVLPVTEAHVDYKASARYDDLITVETWVAELGRASARFAYRILRDDGALLATGHTVHACLEPGGRFQRMPEELAALMRAGEELAG